MQDWNYLNTNDFEVTIEVACEKIVDQDSLRDYWNDNKYALISYLGQVCSSNNILTIEIKTNIHVNLCKKKKVHKGIKGVVTDDSSKAPIVNATIQIEGISHNVSTYIYGDYWRVLAPGRYYVVASHQGYAFLFDCSRFVYVSLKFNFAKFKSYETKKVQIVVGSGSATIVNFELKSTESGYKKIVSDLVVLASTNTYGLLIIGLVLMSVSLVLVTFACIHKRKMTNNRQKLNSSDMKFSLGKNINSVGFHKYNEIVDNGHDEEFGKRSGGGGGSSSSGSRKDMNRYTKTNDDLSANQKLLFADNDDDDEDDKIFIR
jgi:hypothetical protein